jgi:hypothetical protein
MHNALAFPTAIVISLVLTGCRSLAPRQEARQRALILTQTIEQDFWDPEKRAYLEESPPRAKGLPYAMMWANGVQFTVLSGAVRAGADEYAPHMREFLAGMERFWNGRRQLYSAYFGGTDDVYYDDNQWLVLAYVEAYEATRDQAYLDKAVAITEGCLKGVDAVAGGGSYWHVDRKKYPTKNTCANGPLATALLRVRKHLEDQEVRARYLKQAEEVLIWTRDTLKDGRGLMLDSIHTETGKVNTWTFTYNTALMIQGWLELYAVTGKSTHLAEANQLARASAHWLKAHAPAPDGHHYEDATFFVVHLVEALLHLHAITGEDRWLVLGEQTADFYWHAWRRGRTHKLLETAAIARMQWLLADAGRTHLAACPPGVRYIRIEADGKNRPLVLGEVDVVCDGTNIAATGKAYQSTTIDNAFAVYATDGAIDSISRTSPDRSPSWWELELPRSRNVRDVRIHAHGDGEKGMETATLVLLDAHRRVLWSGVPGSLRE